MNANLEVEIVERRRTTLPIEEAKRVAIEMVRRACDLRRGTTIRDGKLTFEERVGGGSHSWFETVIVRDACELDAAALEVIEAIERDGRK